MKKSLLLVLGGMLLLSACASPERKLSRVYEELPLGSIHPEGWLKEMLVRQRDGITADLDSTYSQVIGPRNGWLGGDGDQWERSQYWLDGLLPLAYILEDEHLKAKAQPWIEWIFASQKEDGSFGPTTDYPKESGLQRSNAQDWWPRMVALKVLQQHYSATGDERVINLMRRYFRYQLETLPQKPLDHWTDWAYFRACDNMICVLWLYEKTGEEWLLDLVEMLHEMGHDYTKMFLEGKDLATKGSIHCVNLAQGLKEPVVYWQLAQDPVYLEATAKGLEDIKRFNGFPTGMFGGDECLHGNNPAQGSELCSAVELMYSMEEMVKITGNLSYVDHLERVAFNALPTQTSDDFTLHQYFQQVNQVNMVEGWHLFDVDNGKTSLVMGFLTGYPCCLCNLHQGWPKFTQNLWYTTDDGGLAALAYAPCSMSADIAGTKVSIVEDTYYPMDGKITFEIAPDAPVTFPLTLRIPSWTTSEATLTVNGEPITGLIAGQTKTISREWKKGDKVVLELPMTLTIDRWFENSVSVERGPLVYALKVEEKWEKKPNKNTKRHGPDHWQVTAASPWNYALYQMDLDDINEAYEVVVDQEKLASNWYWNLESVPLTIKARGTRLEAWGLSYGSAAQPPYSTISRKCTNKNSNWESGGNWDELTLVPYGATTLRIAEFPVVTR